LCAGLTIFFERVLQDLFRQHRLGQHLLELRVLPLQFLQPPGLVQVHVPKLLPPTVERHVRDVLLPADFHDALPAVHFPQDADFLLRAITFPFHDLGPFCWAQTNSSSGPKKRDHVSPYSGNHGDSHGPLMNEFVSAILQDRTPLVNIAMALNLTVAGIVAHQSALREGEWLKIPEYRL
jgi:hypothetical protein